MIHRGQIVEEIIRESGYHLTKLAEKLGVTRNTLYNKFKKADLSYRFIIEVGRFIYYDFTTDFPEMKEQPNLMEENMFLSSGNTAVELSSMERKYAGLLERYIKLLTNLVRIANEYELYSLRQEIQKLLEMDTGGPATT